MKRCLVADNSEVIRKVARHFLEADGFEVLEAENATTALALCKQKAPDIVVLDWRLAGMTTLEFMSALRFSGSQKRPYVIYFTTDNDPAELGRMFTAGVDNFLLKPFDRNSWSEKFSEIRLSAA